MHAATVVIGDKLGLYRALAEQVRSRAPSGPDAPANEAGFGRFRRATETLFNRIFEVRK